MDTLLGMRSLVGRDYIEGQSIIFSKNKHYLDKTISIRYAGKTATKKDIFDYTLKLYIQGLKKESDVAEKLFKKSATTPIGLLSCC